MKRSLFTFAASCLACLAGSAAEGRAEPVRITARVVRENGSPVTGLAVRLVFGGESSPRSPQAGKRLTTDGKGSVTRSLDAPVTTRKVRTGFLSSQASRAFDVGLEMELAGRRVLYWIEIDVLKSGVMAGMSAWVPGAAGHFDRRLTFHSGSHAWSFPDAPGGMLMTSIGADVIKQEVTQAADGTWQVSLVVKKETFTVR
ncbi:MAG: hypothetical protein JNG86_12375 [Verrucomicrobiaceae bacterium]|nr:hypothetical protein [Verrucomicrobiaceae bacterium]